MGSEISLRPVTSEDEGFLRLVYAEGRREEFAQVAWPAGMLETFLRQQFDAQRAHYTEGNYPGAEYTVIELDGEPVGRLYVQRGGAETRVMEIGLVAAARGKGIGTKLLQGVLDEGRPVTIHVERHNPALRLYLRLGFQIVADLGVYLQLRWAPVS
jgi:ribosomal protein S18 acetylase RimI-like enzyme